MEPRPLCPRWLPLLLAALPPACSFQDFALRLSSHPQGELQLWFRSSWTPVCGPSYWANADGARAACQAMGYRSGRHVVQDSANASVLASDGIYVGSCGKGELPGRCSAFPLCGKHALGAACGPCQKGQRAATLLECVGRQAASELQLTGTELRLAGSPVCDLGFAEDDVGASAACRALGYLSGKVGRRGLLLKEKAAMVGRCRPGEALKSCSGGAEEASGGCLFGSVGCGACAKGQNRGMELQCLGGKGQFAFVNMAADGSSSSGAELGKVPLGAKLVLDAPSVVMGRQADQDVVTEWSNEAVAGRQFVHTPAQRLKAVQYIFYGKEDSSAVFLSVNGAPRAPFPLQKGQRFALNVSGPLGSGGAMPRSVVTVTSTGDLLLASLGYDKEGVAGFYAPVAPAARAIYGLCAKCGVAAVGAGGGPARATRMCSDGSVSEVSLPFYEDGSSNCAFGGCNWCRFSSETLIGGTSCEKWNAADCTPMLPADYFQRSVQLPVAVDYVSVVSNEQQSCTDGEAVYGLRGRGRVFGLALSKLLKAGSVLSCNKPAAFTAIVTGTALEKLDEASLVAVAGRGRPVALPASWGATSGGGVWLRNYDFEASYVGNCVPGWSCGGWVTSLRTGVHSSEKLRKFGAYVVLEPGISLAQTLLGLEVGSLYSLRFIVGKVSSAAANLTVTFGKGKMVVLPVAEQALRRAQLNFRAWAASLELKFLVVGEGDVSVDEVQVLPGRAAWQPATAMDQRSLDYDSCLRALDFEGARLLSTTAASSVSFQVTKSTSAAVRLQGSGVRFTLSLGKDGAVSFGPDAAQRCGSARPGDYLALLYDSHNEGVVALKNGLELARAAFDAGEDLFAYAEVSEVGGELCELAYDDLRAVTTTSTKALPTSTTTTLFAPPRTTSTTATATTTTLRRLRSTSTSTATMTTTTTGTTATITTTTEGETMPETMDSVLKKLMAGAPAAQQGSTVGHVVAGRVITGAGKLEVQGTGASVDVPASLLKTLRSKEVFVLASVLSKSDTRMRDAKVKSAIEVDVRNTITGTRMAVKGLRDRIKVTLPMNYSEGLGCAFWDEVTQAWADNGVRLAENTSSGGKMSCETSHLSLFGSIIQGFIATFECSNMGLLNLEALKMMAEPGWAGSPGALIFWGVLGLLLTTLAVGLCLEHNRKDGWSDEHFLIGRKPPTEEEAREWFRLDKTRTSALVGGGALFGCYQCMKDSSALRDAVDDLMGSYCEFFSDIRDTLEQMWDGMDILSHDAAAEGSFAFIMTHRAMCAMLVSTARHQAAGSLHVTGDVVTFVTENEELHEILMARSERLRVLLNNAPAEGGEFPKELFGGKEPLDCFGLATTSKDTEPAPEPAPSNVSLESLQEMCWELEDAPHEPEVQLPHLDASRSAGKRITKDLPPTVKERMPNYSQAVQFARIAELPMAQQPSVTSSNSPEPRSPKASGLALAVKRVISEGTRILGTHSHRQVGREEAWARLHEDVKEAMDRNFHKSGSLKALPRTVLQLWWLHTPLGATFTQCVFTPSSMRSLFLLLDILGALLLASLFFQGDAGTMTRGRRARAGCSADVSGFLQHIGRIFAIGLCSFALASLPVSLLSSLHHRKFKTMDIEGSKEWCRQLQVWRIQDAIIWVCGTIYGVVAVFFISLFLANISSEDSVSWALSATISMSLSFVFVPLFLALFIPLVAALLVKVVSVWAKTEHHEIIQGRHEELQQKRIGTDNLVGGGTLAAPAKAEALC